MLMDSRRKLCVWIERMIEKKEKEIDLNHKLCCKYVVVVWTLCYL